MSAPWRQVVLQLSRLSIRNSQCSLGGDIPKVSNGCVRSFHTQGAPLAFQATQPLAFQATQPCCSSVMRKKKRRLDPSVLKNRAERRIRKIEKEIKKLNRFGRKLKPIEEIEGDMQLHKTLDKRKRLQETPTFEEMEYRALLSKDWTRFKYAEHNTMERKMNIAMAARNEALMELRNVSEELYQQAIQLDEGLFEMKFKGPLATPPIKDYDSPDGDYVDTTRDFDKY